jgi:hypothetical protein
MTIHSWGAAVRKREAARTVPRLSRTDHQGRTGLAEAAAPFLLPRCCSWGGRPKPALHLQMVYQPRLLYHHSATKEHYKVGYTTNTEAPS